MTGFGGVGSLNEGRDVNPGDTSADSGVPVPRLLALNEGRDVNPGDTRAWRRPWRAPATLNEGRDVNPGDTRDRTRGSVGAHQRSTKAGT